MNARQRDNGILLYLIHFFMWFTFTLGICINEGLLHSFINHKTAMYFMNHNKQPYGTKDYSKSTFICFSFLWISSVSISDTDMPEVRLLPLVLPADAFDTSKILTDLLTEETESSKFA